MYSHLQRQFRDKITDINKTLIAMALDPRLMPGVVSTASTPSLRSREGSVVPTARDAGGNVRVVVRVRGFLPRGEYFISIGKLLGNSTNITI